MMEMLNIMLMMVSIEMEQQMLMLWWIIKINLKK